MAKSITVYMKNGIIKDFPHTGRAGGSYTKSIRYEGNFAVIKDEYDNEVAIPSQDIERVDVRSHC